MHDFIPGLDAGLTEGVLRLTVGLRQIKCIVKICVVRSDADAALLAVVDLNLLLWLHLRESWGSHKTRVVRTYVHHHKQPPTQHANSPVRANASASSIPSRYLSWSPDTFATTIQCFGPWYSTLSNISFWGSRRASTVIPVESSVTLFLNLHVSSFSRPIICVCALVFIYGTSLPNRAGIFLPFFQEPSERRYL